MCLTVPGSVPGVLLWVSVGCSVFLVLKCAPIDDEPHVLGSCVATNAIRMDPRFSALLFTDIRA